MQTHRLEITSWYQIFHIKKVVRNRQHWHKTNFASGSTIEFLHEICDVLKSEQKTVKWRKNGRIFIVNA